MTNGTYNILFIDFGSGFFPIGCLISNSFSEEIETIDSTTRDNAGWKTQTLTNQSYNIEFSGIVINTLFSKGDFTKISYDRLKEIKRNRQLIDWKIQDNNLQFIESGKGQITSLSSESNIDEFITFSASLQGYGSPKSTSGKLYSLQDGNTNKLQDGNTNEITII
tara:strand:+ start:499 stop:993 length:495 start_codon:yes stop_codon:yes gene_type:complete